MPDPPPASLFAALRLRFVVFSAAIGRFVSDEGPRRKANARYHGPMSSAGRPAPVSWARASRAATFVLPTASVLVAALVFLGPGALRPTIGARLRGLPADGALAVALRVEVVKSFYEVDDSAGIQDLLVEASAPGQTLRAFHGPTGPDGIAEVRLEGSAPIRGPVAIRVTALGARPRLLAGGEIALGRPPPAFVQLGTLVGTAQGELGLRVDATRGFLAAPFPEVLHVHVDPRPGARVEIELAGPGLDVAPARQTADDSGAASFRVRALAHQVELTVTARVDGKVGRWEGTLPVVPGAMWLSPPGSSPTLALLSPSPRERAYVSFWSEEGRVAGAVVPLARDAQGFFAGEVKPPDLPLARVLYATVAGDPVERGAGTIAWPLRPPSGAVVPRPLDLLLDGVPSALEREKQRAWVTRRAGLLLIGAAALAEALLLLAGGRASQRRLEAHMIDASGTLPAADRARLLGATREHPVLRALLAVALVGLAFAMVAALTTFR